jgi:hypothetical protein
MEPKLRLESTKERYNSDEMDAKWSITIINNSQLATGLQDSILYFEYNDSEVELYREITTKANLKDLDSEYTETANKNNSNLVGIKVKPSKLVSRDLQNIYARSNQSVSVYILFNSNMSLESADINIKCYLMTENGECGMTEIKLYEHEGNV